MERTDQGVHIIKVTMKQYARTKRIVTATSMATCALLLSATACFAGRWSASEAWGEQQASYAPDFGNTSMYEYNGQDGYVHVSPKTRFRFVRSAIDAINDYYRRDTYYTFDISLLESTNRSMSAYYVWSTLPGAKYEVEDDPEWRGGNGFNDESEVVSLQPYNMAANSDYRVESWFRVFDESVPVDFEFGSQESVKRGAEYNAVQISPHIQRDYPY